MTRASKRHFRSASQARSLLACGLLPLTVALCVACAPQKRTTELTIARQPGSGDATSVSTSVDGTVIASLRQEWETEMISANGSAPVIQKYPEEARNRELARRGAILDAQRNLAQMVSSIRITATVSMSDLETSDLVRSQTSAVIRDVEVTRERYDEQGKRFEVSVRMPKVKLIKIVEESTRR